MDTKDSRKIAHRLDPVIRVGKEGITDSLIEQIKTYIKKHKMIKVKFLKVDNKDEKFKELAERTNTELIHQIGFTIVLKRK